MRILTVLLAIGLVLLIVASAVAQVSHPSRQTPLPSGVGVGGSASSVGINSNTNTLSTGSNTNTNANSNSQFLSGNNTGVNNGSLEVYSGADPYQGIILEGSVDLPQLPGFFPAPNNFSQPYRPETFVNVPAFLPAEMTLDESKECRDSKVSWYGGSREKSKSIRLFYAAKQETPSIALTMASYVGTAMAQTADGPFIAALCEAAYKAMRKGATVGFVDYSVRPKNTMSGVGYGASGGATGLPAAGAHPYAIAGALGFGTGWSNQRVEGEVMLQLTALREDAKSATAVPVPSSPPVRPTIPGRVGEGPVPTPPEPIVPDASENDREAAAAARTLVSESESDSSQAGQESRRAADRDDLSPSTAEEGKRATAPSSDDGSTPRAADGPQTPAQKGSVPDGPGIPSVPSDTASQRGPGGAQQTASLRPLPEVMYHSAKKLTAIRSGDRKERIFDIFGTEFVKQRGKIVRIDGMRLQASGRSEHNTRIEVSEVALAEPSGVETLYWFFFEDGRLLAWGRPQQWASTAARYRVNLAYPGAAAGADAAAGKAGR